MLSTILEYLSNDCLKASVTVDNKIYHLDNDYEKHVYALNLFLVLDGKRLAYCINVDPNNHTTNQYYAQMAKLIDNRLSIYLPYSHEPFIILKENYNRVDNLYKQNLGELLGYAYTGPHWLGLSVCDLYYAIHMTAVNDKEYILYSFHVPSIYYTQNIINHINEKKELFEQSLKGYEIKIKCGHMTKHNYILEENLPIINA